jgi:hypothetical protein
MEKLLSEAERQKRKQLLDMLKLEEAVVSAKGLRAGPRIGKRYFEPFKDSMTCLNFSRESLEPCNECWLMEFVPEDFNDKALVCHQIPMNEKGETVVSLKARGDIALLEQTVLSWLRKKIAEVEQELGEEAAGPSELAAV